MSALGSIKHRFVKAVCTDRTGTVIIRLTRGRARFRGASIDVSDWEPHLAAALVFRLYERSEARFAAQYLGDRPRVLELGGNRGAVSSSLLQVLPRDAELVSVEANAGLVPDLRRNLARNSGGRHVEGRHLALSDGELVRFDASRGALGSKLSETGDEVPTTTLAALIDELGWADYALLSDIEGAEASFVLGDGAGLERCTRMVIELHDTTFRGEPVTVDALIAALRGRGFRLADRHADVCVFVRT